MFARAIAAVTAVTAAALAAGCAASSAPQIAVPALTDAIPAQRAWAATCAEWDGWDKPGPPFRIHGQTYYVGTCGITALLIAGPDGHVLIDSGTEKGAEVVLANIRALGFDPRDVKLLLMSHEHFDHVGGMARLQAATGARVIASAPAAPVLRSGTTAADDPQAAIGHPPFPPVTGAIDVLAGDAPVRLGQRTFHPISTPGHTPGALSWHWRECEGGDCRTIVYADSLNPISGDGWRFSDRPALVAAFRAGIARVAALDCGILIAPHPGAAQLRDRAAGTRPLADAGACRAYADSVTQRLDARLAKEAAGG